MLPKKVLPITTFFNIKKQQKKTKTDESMRYKNSFVADISTADTPAAFYGINISKSNVIHILKFL